MENFWILNSENCKKVGNYFWYIPHDLQRKTSVIKLNQILKKIIFNGQEIFLNFIWWADVFSE